MYDEYYSEVTTDDVDDFLMHYGVKGMKWGKRKKKVYYDPSDISTRLAEVHRDFKNGKTGPSETSSQLKFLKEQLEAYARRQTMPQKQPSGTSSKKDAIKKQLEAYARRQTGMSHSDDDNYLMHYGVKGMKWGKHKKREKTTSSNTKSDKGLDSFMLSMEQTMWNDTYKSTMKKIKEHKENGTLTQNDVDSFNKLVDAWLQIQIEKDNYNLAKNSKYDADTLRKMRDDQAARLGKNNPDFLKEYNSLKQKQGTTVALAKQRADEAKKKMAGLLREQQSASRKAENRKWNTLKTAERKKKEAKEAAERQKRANYNAEWQRRFDWAKKANNAENVKASEERKKINRQSNAMKSAMKKREAAERQKEANTKAEWQRREDSWKKAANAQNRAESEKRKAENRKRNAAKQARKRQDAVRKGKLPYDAKKSAEELMKWNGD